MSNISDNSPNSLKPKPQAQTVSKKVLYGILAAFLVVFCVLYYSINYGSVSRNTSSRTEATHIQEPTSQPQNFFLVDGSGLATNLGEESQEVQTSGIILPEESPAEEAPSPQEIVIVRGQPEEVAVNQELEEIRRLRTQNYLSALNSPIISAQYNTDNTQAQNVSLNPDMYTPQVNPLAMSMDMSGAQQNSYDPSASVDQEDFFNRSQPDNTWISSDFRTIGQQFEIKTGTVIPAIMMTGINSDLPGNIIAQVSQNVYDTASGMSLLIPQGSKLFGVYDSRIIYGQERVLVAWNRIIFPDGSAITLPAMPGADLSGNAGFHDEVDNHYFRVFGSAVLMSLITGTTAYAVDTFGGGAEDDSSLQSQLTSSLAQQIGQTSATLLEQNLNVKPTLEIRSGYQFNIVLTKDLIFDSAYEAWR